jgi:Fe2+ transport system protein FeoA
MWKNPGWHAWLRAGLSRPAANLPNARIKCPPGADLMTLFGYEFKFGEPGSRTNVKLSGNACPWFSLAQVKPGRRVRINGFLPGLSAARSWHLQSYGVVPGCWLRVVQQSPVTIVQVEHLELALERGLAALIQVDEN